MSELEDRSSWFQPPFQSGDRRALRLLLYLAVAAAGLVVLSFAATIAAYFSDILAIFFLAWLLAFLLDPPATLLVRQVSWMPRAVAVLLVYFILAVVLVVIAVVIADALSQSIQAFVQTAPRLREDLPGLLAPAQQRLDAIGLSQFRLAPGAIGILDSFNAGSGEVLRPIQQIAEFGLNAFGTFSIILFLSIYMAADGERLRVAMHRLFPARFENNLAVFENSVARSFGGFVRGQVILGLAYGGIALVTCLGLGLPYVPLVVGTVTVLHMIPFFGPFVSWSPPFIVAVLFAPAVALPALLIMGISMLLLMNLLQPRVMGDAVGLHPVIVLGSVLVGAKLAGVLGAIFAVPVAAVLAAVIFQWRHRVLDAPATIQEMQEAARAATAAANAAAEAAGSGRPRITPRRRAAPTSAATVARVAGATASIATNASATAAPPLAAAGADTTPEPVASPGPSLRRRLSRGTAPGR